jgi:hypothetical protein
MTVRGRHRVFLYSIRVMLGEPAFLVVEAETSKNRRVRKIYTFSTVNPFSYHLIYSRWFEYGLRCTEVSCSPFDIAFNILTTSHWYVDQARSEWILLAMKPSLF